MVRPALKLSMRPLHKPISASPCVGPIGLALLVAALAAPLLALRRARKEPLVPAAAAAYVAYLVHAAGDWDWQLPAVTLAALLCGAAVLVAARRGEPREWSRPARAVAASLAVAVVAVSVVVAVGNSPLQTWQVGQLHFEPFWGLLVAAVYATT